MMLDFSNEFPMPAKKITKSFLEFTLREAPVYGTLNPPPISR